MASSNIRGVLTSFSPSLDFLAISSGDGRIKIWDTLKGHLQTEFANIASVDATELYQKYERGHLSVDYTCMKWISVEKKKKRKLVCSLLVLGTGSGDVLALDVSDGQMKWKISDCHPGGVNAISLSTHGLCIYTAGVDGMICQIDSLTGSQLGKFRASIKAVSSISVSSDGKTLATAAARLKIFDCSDYKKIQKFSGHPGAVRCMIFTEDGKYILSSAAGERYIAIWRVDGSKNQSSSCVLAMEHPAVFLDSKNIHDTDTDDVGLCVLAISELGVCYLWFGRNINELRNTKPTKVSPYLDDFLSKNYKGALPAIFAAKLQGVVTHTSGHVHVAHGLLIKPSFEKVVVQHGVDMKLSSSQDGVLLPINQSHKAKKAQDIQTGVTALDRANAKDALLPIPKLYDIHEKKRRHQNSGMEPDVLMDEDIINSSIQAKPVYTKDDQEKVEVDTVTTCMEDRLRSLGILSNDDTLAHTSALNMIMLSDGLPDTSIPQKSIKRAVLSMTPSDAYKLLSVLVVLWQSRAGSGKLVLPWICSILLNHAGYVLSQEPATQILDSLFKMSESKGVAIQSLLQLSGRLQLITAQINKASQSNIPISTYDHRLDGSEDEDEDIDEFVYGEEEDNSQSSSDDE